MVRGYAREPGSPRPVALIVHSGTTMAGIFSFKCSCCGEVHEGSPSFGFRAPAPYLEQTKAVQEAGFLGSDLCWYEDDDGVHYFIRVCLEIAVHRVTQPFIWGVWVSLSKKNFDRYVETFDEADVTDQYFGWLCNYLPYYESTYALRTKVHPRAGKSRPCIELEASEHPLAIDYYNGITIERAQEIAELAMHNTAP
jgi:hypothetical protein